MKPDIYDRVEKSFRTEGSLITFIHGDNIYRAMQELNKLVAADDTIPETYRKTFNDLYSKDHIKNILQKTGYQNTLQLVAEVVEKRLILPKY